MCLDVLAFDKDQRNNQQDRTYRIDATNQEALSKLNDEVKVLVAEELRARRAKEPV